MRTRISLILLLLSAGVSVAGWNDGFADDPNCVALWSFDDLADYFVELDPSSMLSMTATTVTLTGYDAWMTNCRVRRNFGAAYFGGDFIHKFQFNLSSVGLGNDLCDFYALANTDTTIDALIDAGADCLRVMWLNSAIYLQAIENGVATSDNTAAVFAVGTTYYVKVVRDDDGGANSTGRVQTHLSSGNYYGEAGSVDIDILQVDCGIGEQNDYSLLFFPTSFNGGSSTIAISGVLSNLDIGSGVVDVSCVFPDGKGNNDLSMVGLISQNSVDYQEGTGSGDFESTENDYMTLANAGLDTGFPGKNGDTNKKLSACAWFKLESLPASGAPDNGNRHIAGIWTSPTLSWVFGATLSGVNTRATLGTAAAPGEAGDEEWAYNTGTTLSAGTWYHVGVAYDDSDHSYLIRLYDTGSSTAYTATGTLTDPMNIEAGAFYVGRNGAGVGEFDGLLDELVVFNDVLTADEIDQIRGGTYGETEESTVNPELIVIDESE